MRWNDENKGAHVFCVRSLSFLSTQLTAGRPPGCPAETRRRRARRRRAGEEWREEKRENERGCFSLSRRARGRGRPSPSPLSLSLFSLTRTKPASPYDRAATSGTPAARKDASRASSAGQGRPAAITSENPEQTPGRWTARSAGASTAKDAATPGLSSAARAATAAARGRPTSAAATRKLLPRSVGVTWR